MKILVVIPNWNGADFIADCLRSLQAQSLSHAVVVVDNGSVDNSVEIIEKEFPAAQLIKLPQNTGFSGGVNTGIRYAMEHNFEAVALLNNDAQADPNWLKHLHGRLQSNNRIGIVCSKQLQTDTQHLDCTGGEYSVWGMPFPRDRNQLDTNQHDAEPVFGAPGGASLYRLSMLQEIGLFDETFFAYYEDDDISFRARLLGWEIWYEPNARVIHHIAGTTSKLGSFTRYHATKNFYLLYAKNMPGWLYFKYLPLFALQALRLAGSSLLRGGFLTYLRGAGRAVMLTPHIISERKRIQSTRKTTPAQIDKLLYKHRPPKVLPHAD